MVISVETKIYFSIIIAPAPATTKAATTQAATTEDATAEIAEIVEYCYHENTDFLGADIPNIVNPVKDIATAHDCQEKCHFTEGCLYWTYMPTTYTHEYMAEYKGSCWLKHGTGTINEFQGIFSGPKYCREYQ